MRVAELEKSFDIMHVLNVKPKHGLCIADRNRKGPW